MGVPQLGHVHLVQETCCNCGVVFAMPADLNQRCRDEGSKRNFYCPNGHPQHYTEGAIAKLERQLRNERERADRANSARKWAEGQADRARRSASARKGQVTRIKNRLAAGQCPCCDRRFEDLQRHLEEAHPHFRADGDAEPAAPAGVGGEEARDAT